MASHAELLVHIDIIASHSCCRIVSWTPMMRLSCCTTSQSCSIGLRSGDSKAIWVQQTHSHVEKNKNGQRWFDDFLRRDAFSPQKQAPTWVHCGHKGMGRASKWTHFAANTNTSMNYWYRAKWINAFMLFTPNSQPTDAMLQHKSRLIRPGNIFPLTSVNWTKVTSVLRWQEWRLVWSSSALDVHLIYLFLCARLILICISVTRTGV